MNRSRVNAILEEARETLARARFGLPPFAWWTPAEFRDRATRPILDGRLGWDLAHFGTGDADRTGLLQFTLRNGSLAELAGGAGRVYAERLLFLRPGQTVPLHTHLLKTRDLVNRWGGPLGVTACGSDDRGRPDPHRGLMLGCDGIDRWIAPGARLRLEPGESVTLRPGDWHALHVEGGRPCLVGDISTVNDDLNDIQHAGPRPRPPIIFEDDDPLHLLVADYADWLADGWPV